MIWNIKKFEQLTNRELFDIYKARVLVFVVEQECPYPEVDDADLNCLHIWTQHNQGVQAYCRLILEEDGIHLGRVLVEQSQRKSGLGRILVAKALEVIEERYPNVPIHAQAQAYLEKFYEGFGFKAISDVYLEDDIPHIDMLIEK